MADRQDRNVSLSPHQDPNGPAVQCAQVRAWFERLVRVAIRDVQEGRVENGDAVMKRLRSRLEARRR